MKLNQQKHHPQHRHQLHCHPQRKQVGISTCYCYATFICSLDIEIDDNLAGQLREALFEMCCFHMGIARKGGGV